MKLEDQELQEITDRVIENIRPMLSCKCNHDDKYLTVKQLSQYIGLSSQWVYNNIKNLPHINIGNKPLFKKSEIDNYLERYREKLPENNSLRPREEVKILFNTNAFKKQKTSTCKI